MWEFSFVTCFTYSLSWTLYLTLLIPKSSRRAVFLSTFKILQYLPSVESIWLKFCFLKILPDWKYQNTNTLAGYSSVMSLNMLFSAVYMELELFPFLIDIQNLQFCVCFMWKGISWHLWASMVLEYSGVCPVLFKECWCQQSQISKS
jgi:hypothetical protein